MSNPHLRTMRALATCYQAFEAYSAGHVRAFGLTAAQFDIVATLGNTAGMSCKELGERTLITKGTLTGVLNRLESRGLIRRTTRAEDRRSVFVTLTRSGQRLFDQVFPEHVVHCAPPFAALSPEEMQTLDSLLRRLATAFTSGASGKAPDAPSSKARLLAAAQQEP
jgi:DNA-binding MarR family transcriptional regulator